MNLANNALRRVFVFLALAASLVITHLPLLRLPYFWDEAGYYIPAARDLLLDGSLIPQSTISNAHPPLVMAYLALSWKLFGYSPLVTRVAMLLNAAFALLGVFELARQVAERGVAIASTICVAVYPVFFAQSSLALVDLAAAGLTFWGLRSYVRREFGRAAFWFTLAALAKETAIIAPLALLLWEAIQEWRSSKSCESLRWLWLLSPVVPLAGWFAFHHARTGYVFGNPEFLRYNVSATLQLLRILFAFVRRGWQLFGHMNLLVLTVAAVLAMMFAPIRDSGRERERIAVSDQLAFAVVIAAYWVLLSFIGGAVLARYMLPAVPLVIIICVSTIRRRVRAWPVVIALICAAFVGGLFFNPPYVFAPEDNLAYSDYVRLHQDAAAFLQHQETSSTVLTAWPASDELNRPWLGYVNSPTAVTAIPDFSEAQLLAARNRSFDVALVFSTKYEPPRKLLLPEFWQRSQEKFFDYHRDASPALAAEILGGQIAFEERRGGQWAAVIERARTKEASREADPPFGSAQVLGPKDLRQTRRSE